MIFIARALPGSLAILGIMRRAGFIPQPKLFQRGWHRFSGFRGGSCAIG